MNDWLEDEENWEMKLIHQVLIFGKKNQLPKNRMKTWPSSRSWGKEGGLSWWPSSGPGRWCPHRGCLADSLCTQQTTSWCPICMDLDKVRCFQKGWEGWRMLKKPCHTRKHWKNWDDLFWRTVWGVWWKRLVSKIFENLSCGRRIRVTAVPGQGRTRPDEVEVKGRWHHTEKWLIALKSKGSQQP